jgi:hypothetical protein
MSNPIYAYRGYVYEILHDKNGKVVKRQMRFLSTNPEIKSETYNLDSYGEITLQDFRDIVNTWLDW